MEPLVFVPLLTYILISIGLGAIPGTLAKRKNRSRSSWWVAGALVFPVALVSILCFRDLDKISDDKKAVSKLKEKIIFAVILVLWVAIILSKIVASSPIDGCLDSGGSFDYESCTCDYKTNHPYKEEHQCR